MDDISLWVVIAQIINFSIIFFIFYYFLWDKIVKIIEERRKKLEALDNSDEVVKQKIQEAEKKSEELISQARKKALSIQKEAEESAKREALQKIQNAEQKAQWIIDWALRDIEKERISMMKSIKEKILDYSLKVNSKIFWESESNKDFIKKEVNSIKI